jgi:hypothetical protein
MGGVSPDQTGRLVQFESGNLEPVGLLGIATHTEPGSRSEMV